jgi:hypothetical protein
MKQHRRRPFNHKRHPASFPPQGAPKPPFGTQRSQSVEPDAVPPMGNEQPEVDSTEATE